MYVVHGKSWWEFFMDGLCEERMQKYHSRNYTEAVTMCLTSGIAHAPTGQRALTSKHVFSVNVAKLLNVMVPVGWM